MPILHRNIGATGHAWAADNGKIVFRSTAPSHQLLMRFTVELVGDIDLTPLFQAGRLYEDYTVADVRSPVFPADSINPHLADRDANWTDMYYNQAEYDDMYMHFSNTWDERDSGGNIVRRWQNIYFDGGIVWGADSWRWSFRLQLTPLLIGTSGSMMNPRSILFPGGTAYALYESSASTQDIRVGGGLALAFQGIGGTGAIDGAGDCFYNTSLELSAQAA